VRRSREKDESQENPKRGKREFGKDADAVVVESPLIGMGGFEPWVRMAGLSTITQGWFPEVSIVIICR
jgi:hypothetical protein